MERIEVPHVSRFKAVGSANEEPGVDFFTGTHVGPFIDTGKKVWILRPEIGTKQYQKVYISIDTLREMAQEAGLLQATDVEKDQAYGQGYADAVKEQIGGQILNVADTLGSVADWLADLSRAVGTPGDELDGVLPDDAPAGGDEDPGAGAAGGSEVEGDRGAGAPDGQGDDADLDKRPAGVSGNPGDASAYLI